MSGARILVVDDEAQIRELVRLYLEREGYVVRGCGDGPGALDAVAEWSPDLMVLDLLLPGMSGQEVCRRLREEGNQIPIIMLTARTTEQDKLAGLRGGADDYVTKPFSPAEVAARVGAVLRRARGGAEAEVAVAGPITVDARTHEVRVNGTPVALTPTEFRLLGAFVREPGRAFTRAQLLDLALGPDFDGFDRNVDVHVMNLRKKLGLQPSPIRTVYGVGYKLEVDGVRA
jgi:DNA-binding response OmpR family regulator